MFGTIHFSTLLLHLYIIAYLIVTVANAPDLLMQIMHILCPFVVIPFLYHTIKSATVTSPATSSEEKEERFETL